MGSPTDDHPDLLSIGRSLQRRLDRVLEAEQEAAAVLARRTSVLRDRLLEAEDAGDHVTVLTVDGHRVGGQVTTVATDHLELRDAGTVVLVTIERIVIVEIP